MVATVIIANFLNRRAFNILSPEEQHRLLCDFTSARRYSMIPVFVIVVIYLILLIQTKIDRTLLSIGFFSALFLVVVFRSIWNHVQLVRLEMPPEYRSRYTIVQIVSMFGIAWFFFAMFGAM